MKANPTHSSKNKFITCLVAIGMLAPAASAQKDDEPVDTLLMIGGAVAELQKNVGETKAAIEAAGQTSANAEAEIDQAIATAKQVLETVGKDGDLYGAIETAIKNTKTELKEIEREGLGDSEAKALLVEIKTEIERELDKLYDQKVKMVEAQSVAIRELEKFEKHKRIYQLMARRERFKIANLKLEEVVRGVLNLSDSLSEINSNIDRPEAETVPVEG